MMLLALPQPGPPPLRVSPARACRRNSEPSVKPEHAGPAHAEQVPPGDAQFTIAQVFAGLSG